MTLILQTFGRLRLEDATGEEIAFPEKALLAACFLLASRQRSETRQAMACFLWGDNDKAGALVNLRKLISRIRERQQQIGIEIFRFTATEVKLAGEHLAVDFRLFDDRPDGQSIARLREMAQKIGVEFLGWLQVDSGLFDTWLLERREYFLDRLREVFAEVAPRAKSPTDFGTIKHVALLLLERRPLDAFVRNALEGARAAKGQSVSAPAVAGAGAPATRSADIVVAGAPLVFAGGAARGSALQADGNPSPEGAGLPRLVLLPPPPSGSGECNAVGGALIEDITIAFCSSRAVSVVAPYTSQQISLQSDKAATFNKHAINYILDTRLTSEAGGHSIFAQLVYFGSDEVIWADRFDLRKAGLLSCRMEIANAISRAVGREVSRNETVRWNMEGDPKAYRTYLLGTRFSKFISLPEVRRSRKLFREALSINGQMAAAMSSLARTYFMEWLLTARGDSELLRIAEQRACQAIEIDETSAAGHRELGVIRLYRRDFDGSLEALDKAEALSPQFANVIASYADTLVQASRPEEGLAKIMRGMELNPLCPDDYFWTAAGASYSIGDYEQALSFIQRMKDRTPADRLAAASWAMLGNRGKARQFVRKTLETHPDFDLDKWLLMVPFREEWQKTHYHEGLLMAGYE
ncbi:DNA-binding SARP family transcriptional activator [Hoeflea marina]|uniref:DNA-binding SARP family transcriptional activator n=1 Tax=Hoeflea marina TaxID=274592 RepID=A0A317PPY3_9HYPH|nr:SARP family transcriptional regulator [Hoeflea marina]PWW03561.1 DNA-binding SARP family transcriptional activator [Hoeflea marina]